jgi:hypothetical protein
LSTRFGDDVLNEDDDVLNEYWIKYRTVRSHPLLSLVLVMKLKIWISIKKPPAFHRQLYFYQYTLNQTSK